jgi:hypothetical protein
MSHLVASFVVRRSVPDALSVVRDILDFYRQYCIAYSIGEDTTLMVGEEPHYHLCMVFHLQRTEQKLMTETWIRKNREKRWKYGQNVSYKINKWDNSMICLGYAAKENEIEKSLAQLVPQYWETEELATDAYYAARCEARAKKLGEITLAKKENEKRENAKLLKEEVLDYVGQHLAIVKTDLESYLAKTGMREHHNYVDADEVTCVRIVLEKYQIEHKKHFQKFEIDKHVFNYFRHIKKYNEIEMYFLRNNNNLR